MSVVVLIQWRSQLVSLGAQRTASAAGATSIGAFAADAKVWRIVRQTGVYKIL